LFSRCALPLPGRRKAVGKLRIGTRSWSVLFVSRPAAFNEDALRLCQRHAVRTDKVVDVRLRIVLPARIVQRFGPEVASVPRRAAKAKRHQVVLLVVPQPGMRHSIGAEGELLALEAGSVLPRRANGARPAGAAYGAVDVGLRHRWIESAGRLNRIGQGISKAPTWRTPALPQERSIHCLASSWRSQLGRRAPASRKQHIDESLFAPLHLAEREHPRTSR
jgi:hypothetical protein